MRSTTLPLRSGRTTFATRVCQPGWRPGCRQRRSPNGLVIRSVVLHQIYAKVMAGMEYSARERSGRALGLADDDVDRE